MANHHQPYWLWSGSFFLVLGVALVGADEKFGTSGARSMSWTGLFMVTAYVAVAAAVACLVCALRDISFPFAVGKTKGENAIDLSDPSGCIVDPDAPRKLASLSKHRTAAQARRLLWPYYGRPIVISGQVTGVSDWMISYSEVVVKLGPRDPRIFMHFTDQATFDGVLSKLGLGTRISVTGEIAVITESSITITDCELESVGK